MRPEAPAFTSHGLAAVTSSKKAEVMAARLASQPARSTSPTEPAVGEACVAHHDVEPAEFLGGLGDQALRRARLAEVARDDQRLGAGAAHEGRDLLRARAVVAGMERDGGIGRGQRAGRRGADAGGGAGDQDDAHQSGSGW